MMSDFGFEVLVGLVLGFGLVDSLVCFVAWLARTGCAVGLIIFEFLELEAGLAN